MIRPRIHSEPVLSSCSRRIGWWEEKKTTMTAVGRSLSAQRVLVGGAKG
jgi:hypothetical protein